MHMLKNGYNNSEINYMRRFKQMGMKFNDIF